MVWQMIKVKAKTICSLSNVLKCCVGQTSVIDIFCSRKKKKICSVFVRISLGEIFLRMSWDFLPRFLLLHLCFFVIHVLVLFWFFRSKFFMHGCWIIRWFFFFFAEFSWCMVCHFEHSRLLIIKSYGPFVCMNLNS